MGFYVLILLFVGFAFGIEDYCSKNTFDNSVSYMHFTKEATFEEFALLKKFKGLHCCAKGYRSIEWYKDDKLYPWALDVSNFIIFPENANQTIYTQDVREVDAGNYTCVLKNDTVIHSHTIHLKVFEKVPDDAKITYISQDKEVRVGQSLRLFCEAFGGQIDLPDAYSEAFWKRVEANGTVLNVPSHMQQLKTSREDGQTFGTYLLIPSIEKEDFGQYVCIISKPGNKIERNVFIREEVDKVEYVNPNPIPVGKMILLSSVLFFIILAFLVLYLQFGVKLQVILKETFEQPEDDQEGKPDDVLIVFAPQDAEIAVGVLVATLQDQFKYKVAAKELTTGVNLWYSELKPSATQSRCILFLLSPSAVNETWESPSILQAISQLTSLGPKVIVVLLKELPKNQWLVKNEKGESLKSITRSVSVVPWVRKNDTKFWYSLRLRMPPKRSTSIESKELIVEEDLRLNKNKQEVMDNLV